MYRFLALLGLLLSTTVTQAQETVAVLSTRPLIHHTKPQIAIIIDDIGYNLPLGERAVALPGNITLAVLPKTPGAEKLANAGFDHGKEIMLHAPMSNHAGAKLGPGGLTDIMDETTFIDTLRNSLDSIPHVQGVNNHMGSVLTTQYTQMSWLMGELKTRDLYFIDSLTDSGSVALSTARQFDVVSQQRDVFLDHNDSIPDIEAAFNRLVRMAERNGYAIGIGHPHPNTLDVLERVLPTLDDKNVELVHISTLLKIN